MHEPEIATLLKGYSLTTAEILYRLPDHPALLQSFIWQDYDLHPRFPKLTSFLDFSDLADNKAQPCHVALQLGQGVWRQRHALRGVHGCQTLGRPPPSRGQARAGSV